jgi:hypothetical protein
VRQPDPRRSPEELEGETELPVEGYGLAASGPASAEPKEEATPRRRPRAYRLADEEPVAPPPREAIVSEHALARHLAERTRDEYVPPRPLTGGVFEFPWYGTSLVAWLKLSLGFFVLAIGWTAVRAFFPFR